MAEPMQEWAKAFVAAQSEMPNIAKNKTAKVKMKSGGEYSYSYADLPDILSSVREVLSSHGLAIVQSVESPAQGYVSVTTRIYHSAGHSESFGPLALPAGNDAQSAGSAITYARRYSLCAALGIAADEDDDGQLAKSSGGATSLKTPKPQAGTSAPPEVQAGSELPSEPKASNQRISPDASPLNSGGGDGVDGEVGVIPPAADLVEVYGKNKVLIVARNLAKANGADRPTTTSEISQELAALVGKHLERESA